MTKHILIADDDVDLTEAFKLRFESAHYSVEVVHNGAEVEKKILKKLPDIMILDVLMPGLDGLGVLQAVNRSRNAKIPAIVLTGQAVMLEQAFRLEGAQVFLRKPVDGNRLVQEVQKILT